MLQPPCYILNYLVMKREAFALFVNFDLHVEIELSFVLCP